MSTVQVRIPRTGAGAGDVDDDDLPQAAAGRFAEPSSDPDGPDLAAVVRRIRSAKRIVVVCGAGVSTAAAIPDFRSANGLFARGSVKDLFHVKSLSSPALLPEHHALLSTISRLAGEAQPTAFHALLKDIDNDGRLLRVYTQNIDGLEERAGLKTGIPPPKTRRRTADVSRASSQPQPNPLSQTQQPSLQPSQQPSRAPSQSLLPSQPPSQPPSQQPSQPPSQPPSQADSPPESGATTPLTRESSPVRCIPLHGLLSSMHCTLCSGSFPISACPPLAGEPISCPDCDQVAAIRSALSERQRRVGTLRPSVVLYGEEHPQGEAIGSVMERDLRGTGPRGEREGRADLLLVAGTSLSIPGVKRIVKEMAKSLAARYAGGSAARDPPIRAVYVNAEAPAKPAEWDGVFDVWAHGDVQDLAALVADEAYAPPLPKTPRRSKKVAGLPTPSATAAGSGTTPRKRQRKGGDDADDSPSKKRGAPSMPLTPASTPPRKRGSSTLPSPSPHRSPSPSPPPRPAFTPELKAEPVGRKTSFWASRKAEAEVEAEAGKVTQPTKPKGSKASPKPRAPAKTKEKAKVPAKPTRSSKRKRKPSPEYTDSADSTDATDGSTPAKKARLAPSASPEPRAPPPYAAVGVARFSPPPPFDDLYGLLGRGGACAVPR